MSLHTERRVVVWNGARFVVTAPTVVTVLTAVRMFAQEIVVLRKEFHADPLTPGVWVEVAAKMLLAKARESATVLSTCCTLHDGAPGQLEDLAYSSHDLRDKLARAMLALCDPEKIVGCLSWDAVDSALGKTPDEEADVDDSDEGPSAIDVMVATVALAFHQPPAAVCEWSYEAVTALFESIVPACQNYERASTVSKKKLAEYGVH